MGSFWQTVTESWQHHVIDEGRLPALAVLVGFLVAFSIVRGIVWSIRAGKGPLHDVSVGGVHLHHMVHGIYWSEEGRASVDAVLLGIAVAAIGVLGIPFWQAIYSKSVTIAATSVGVVHGITIVLTIVAFLKRKRLTAITGLVLPPFAVGGAVRLAHPRSRWAKWL
jgi:hypothetical protein